jgi:hypothetical protein
MFTRDNSITLPWAPEIYVPGRLKLVGRAQEASLLAHPGEVRRRRVVVSVTEQDHKTMHKIPSQMRTVEIEASHADWILDGEVGQHIVAPVCSDSRVNSRGLGQREISRTY